MVLQPKPVIMCSNEGWVATLGYTLSASLFQCCFSLYRNESWYCFLSCVSFVCLLYRYSLGFISVCRDCQPEVWEPKFVHTNLHHGQWTEGPRRAGLWQTSESVCLSLSLLTTHCRMDARKPSLSKILGNPGNPSHMICDVTGDVDACFEWCCFHGVLEF